jgi:DNA gyrase subunit A
MGAGTVPQRFTLRSALDCFLDFRFETLRRQTAFQLNKVASRAHIVDGLIKSLESVDMVIQTIRSAPDQNAAREALMDEKKGLGLSKVQADAVLRLQLGQLTRLNKDKLEDEKQDLQKSRDKLDNLMKSDKAVRKEMVKEFKSLQKKFGIPRRTRIELDEGEAELNEMDLVKNSRSGK